MHGTFRFRHHSFYEGVKTVSSNLKFVLKISNLRAFNTLGRGSAIFIRETTNVSLIAFLPFKTLLKMIYSERQELPLLSSKFFPFKVEPFSEERQNS